MPRLGSRHRLVFVPWSPLLLSVFVSASVGCRHSVPASSADASASPIVLLGIAELPSGQKVDGTAVGGISGIDRDPESEDWYLISDDKSKHGPARFYVASIRVSEHGIDSVRIRNATSIRTSAGATYPPPSQGKESVDAEAIRFDPAERELWWTTEGDKRGDASPALRRMGLEGDWRGEVTLPKMLVWDPSQAWGARPNLSFEGLAWSEDGDGVWLANEAPLFQDGPLGSTQEGALVRLSLLSRNGSLQLQRAYRAEPVPAHPTDRLADNGVSEILDLGKGRMLVMERAGIQQPSDEFDFHVRLYCASLDAGQEISMLPALAGISIRPVDKHLVLDLAEVSGVPQVNFEGMTWGPTLRDGRRTLLLVSDNNFEPHAGTVFAAFAIPDTPGADPFLPFCQGTSR